MAVNIVQRIDGRVRVRHVIVSVSDKQGLDTFAPALTRVCPDVRLYSTGGTHAILQRVLGPAAAKHLVAIADYTGQPEMQGGLVKTLDFTIYLGLLSETYNASHQEDLQRVRGVAFDMVVVNLYPFQETVATPGATVEQARANIDIGGPCMVRAAAKNFIRVAAVTDPADYENILKELQETGGCLSLQTRFSLAQKAFSHTAEYDTAIATYLKTRAFPQVEACYQVV